MTSVLIVHNRPQAVREVLEARLAGFETPLDIHYADTPQRVEPMLRACDPRVVFSIKHDGFPGPYHRPIVDHPSVRWVQVGGSGYDHLQPFDSQRITLTNGAGVLAPYLAETVIGAILALNGHFPRYLEQQRQRRWRPIAFRALRERTLLIVGLGHIGRCVAVNAGALGMRVLATRRSPAPDSAVEAVYPMTALPELLPRADFVSLHLRLTEQTRGLIDAAALAAMKPGAFLINTARGAVVDQAALIEALRSGHLGGAYLDVFETEPLPETSPLWRLPNVLLTPHSSDNIVGWDRLFAELFADNLKRWCRGEELSHRVTA